MFFQQRVQLLLVGFDLLSIIKSKSSHTPASEADRANLCLGRTRGWSIISLFPRRLSFLSRALRHDGAADRPGDLGDEHPAMRVAAFWINDEFAAPEVVKLAPLPVASRKASAFYSQTSVVTNSD